MALALNNLKSVDMPLNKETKPNLIVAPRGALANVQDYDIVVSEFELQET